MGRAYTTFKYSLMKMGGIWEDTDNVYFSQFLPSASIIYAPEYPKYTDNDVEIMIDNALLKYPTYTVRLGNCAKDTVIVKKFNVWKDVEDFLNEHSEFIYRTAS